MMKNIFQKSCKKWGRVTRFRLFPFFKKALHEVDASGLQLSFNIFREPSVWHTIKTTVSNFTILTQIYAQFYLFGKGSGNNFSTTLCLCFSCYTLLIDQTSLSDCFYLLRYRAICVLPLFVSKGSDVINFETNLIFLIKPFLHCTEKSRQKFKYVEKKK